MVETRQITKAEFLTLYAADALKNPLVLTIGAEQRAYALQVKETGGETFTEGYIVVYCVV